MRLFEKIEEIKQNGQLPLFVMLAKEVDKQNYSYLKFVPVKFYNSSKVQVKPHYKPISKIINFDNVSNQQ